MDFIHRSHKPELLDQPGIPATDITRNLYELEVINRLLGGHAVTLEGFKTLAKNHSGITVCEIGCGGGDNLRAIQKQLASSQITLPFIGIDLNPDCIAVAKKAVWKKLPEFIISDYRKVIFDVKPDILFSSLFCHHFTEEQLVDMFCWMRNNASKGFFINDLHRHRIAYYAIRVLTVFFSRSYLVKHDAPLSVLRGFRKNELKNILQKAGIVHYSLKWRWAFRWLLIVSS